MSSSSPAAVMDASIRGSGRVVLARGIDYDFAKGAEELAIGARRRPRRPLLTRLARERAQMPRVYPRVGAHQIVQRAFVLEQAVSPALDAVLLRGVLGRDAVPDLVFLTDRLGIHRSHQLADVLQLPASRLVLRRAPGELDRVAQVLGQSDLGELPWIQLDQARAERLRSEERRVGKECRARWWSEH